LRLDGNPAAKGSKREFKFYRPAQSGRQQLLAEESRWKPMADAIDRVMWPVEEN